MKAENGFTLVELMVTLVVAALLLSLAVPSMTALIKNNRLVASTNSFVSALTVARSEAVKQGRSATLCVSTNQATCNGANWATGWLVWVDANNNAALDAPGEIVRIAEPPDNTVAITHSLASNSFVFSASGTVNVTGNVRICDDRAGNFGRRLDLMTTGAFALTNQVACP